MSAEMFAPYPRPKRFDWESEAVKMKLSALEKPAPKLKAPVGRSTTFTSRSSWDGSSVVFGSKATSSKNPRRRIRVLETCSARAE